MCQPAGIGTLTSGRLSFWSRRTSEDIYAAHLDVKRLAGRDGYRLRVGSWRILYEIDEVVRVIAVEDIRQRKEAYR